MLGILITATASMSRFPSSGSILHQISHQAATFAVNLLVQTTLVLAIGLCAAWAFRQRGVALQSCVLRMTLVAALFCPLASWLLYAAGFSGLRIELTLQDTLLDRPDAVKDSAKLRLNPIVPDTPLLAATRTEMPDSEQILHSSEMRSAYGSPTDVASSHILTESVEAPIADETAAMELLAAPLPVTRTDKLRSLFFYQVICCMWLFSSGLMLLRLIIAHLTMEGLRRESRLAPENVMCECHNIARQMSVTAPPVLVNERLSSPCLLGWLRPAVMIPASLHPIGTDVLAHELAHLRRHDCFWSLLGHLTTAMLPWQPLVWMLTRQMEQTADNVCDDYVVFHNFDRVSYARELVTIAERFPASWTSTTAAVGIAEFQSCLGNRVQRILDGSRDLSLRTGWKNLIMVAAAAVTGTLIAGFLGTARNELNGLAIALSEEKDFGDPTLENDHKLHPAQVTEKLQTSKDEPDKEPQLQFAGSVVDPDYKPIANVRIFAGAWQSLRGVFPERNATHIATTDQNGQFHYDVPSDEPRKKWEFRHIFAASDGYGFAAVNARNLEAKGTLKGNLSPEEARIESFFGIGDIGTVLRLTRDDIPLTGRIINAEGQPVRGIRVRITEVWQSKQENLHSWEKTSTEKTADYYSLRNQASQLLIGAEAPSIIADGISDDDGRVLIKGIGRDRVVKLVISGPGIELAEFHARTRKGETVVVPHEWDFSSDLKETYRAAEFVHVVSISIPVIGQVTDSETGKPIAGVRVGNGYQGFWTGRGSRQLTATTDADGRYRLDGLPVNKSHKLLAFPPNESLYLPAGAKVATTLGQAEVVKDIQLRAGVLVSGRAVDSQTGAPIQGHVSYYAFASNEHVKDYPGFRTLGADHERGANADGRFAIPVMPGQGILTFGPKDHQRYSRGQGADSIEESSELPLGDRQYRTVPTILDPMGTIALQKIDVPVGTASTEVTFQIQSGKDVDGKLIDDKGNLVTGAIATGQDGFGDGWYSLTDSSFRVRAFYPESPRTLGFYQPERELAASFRLDKVPTEPLVITLHPSGGIRGRLIDKNRIPLSQYILSGDGIPTKGLTEKRQPLATDEEGRFEIRGLVPGREYTVLGSSIPGGDGTAMMGTVLKAISIESAQVRDVGDVTLQPE